MFHVKQKSYQHSFHVKQIGAYLAVLRLFWVSFSVLLILFTL